MNKNLLTHCKSIVKSISDAMYDFEAGSVKQALGAALSDDCVVHLCHPFGDCVGADELYEKAYAPLLQAWPDLERREYIRIAGNTEADLQWVGCAGYYSGVFVNSWLDIPPTGHLVTMRFHEFYRFENEKIVEIQSIWDIPDVMLQAGAWPMAPSLGRELHIPGPASLDGVSDQCDAQQGLESCSHIINMLAAMIKHPAQGGPEVMELERFWHPRMNWYGPSGIGTSRGIDGFRNWHQIPFLNAMPDRGQYPDEVSHHFFGDGNYVGVTGWPDMMQTLSDDGWLGIAASGKKISLRSLDFWRLENGLIRENWVLVDLLDVYQQINVDVFARLREFNKARNYCSAIFQR